MSLETRIIALAQAVGADVKALTAAQGNLDRLSTVSKTNLVSAINEIATAVASAGVAINDEAGNGDITVTWSADKIFYNIELAKTAVKDDLVNGASAALDTLSELAAALGNDANFAATMATELGNRVRYDAAQTLTELQKTQARDNIGAADATATTTLATDLGTFDRDYVADYALAKA